MLNGTFREAVIGVLASGALGWFGSWAQGKLMLGEGKLATWMQGLDAFWTRTIAWAIAILSVAAVYLFTVWMGWAHQPVTGQEWVQALAPFWLIALGSGQTRHARRKDRGLN